MDSANVLYLTDRHGRALGKIVVDQIEGAKHLGTFEPLDLPPKVEELFLRYEQLIEGQVLSLMDEIESEIDSYGFTVSKERGQPGERITDLQVYRDGGVSFQVVLCRTEPAGGR